MSVLDTLTSGTDTDRKIYEGTLSCLARFGVAKTQLQDIADAAGVSRTTMYSWTPPDGEGAAESDRVDDVLAWVGRAGARRLAESLRRDINHEVDPRERLVRGIMSAIAALDGCAGFQHVLRYEPDTLGQILVGAFPTFIAEVGWPIRHCTEAALREKGTPASGDGKGSDRLVRVVSGYVLAGDRNSLRDRAEVERIVDHHLSVAAA